MSISGKRDAVQEKSNRSGRLKIKAIVFFIGCSVVLMLFPKVDSYSGVDGEHDWLGVTVGVQRMILRRNEPAYFRLEENADSLTEIELDAPCSQQGNPYVISLEAVAIERCA